ncbi:MAG: c-type cytochrome [Deltaproteobacteria bacterium]|nr:c-type cytochrome [Deltaproteobacteria bacterium]
MRRTVLLFAIATGLALGAGCGKNDRPPPPSTGAPDMQTETGPKGAQAGKIPQQAELLFREKCAMCHGLDGTGNGPGARELPVKPRNYTDPKWQESVTDDEIRKIILLGGMAVGKSGNMPGNPDLKDEPDVLEGLVKIVRRFGKK